MNQGGRDWKGTERNTKRKRKRVRVKERERVSERVRGRGEAMARGAWDTREGKGELALFYRKGLIALPITDNATINDLREVGLRTGKGGRRGRGWTERGTGMEIGTWSRMGMRLGIWEQVEVGACKRDNVESLVLCVWFRACVSACVLRAYD